jgi:hypothetical protein
MMDREKILLVSYLGLPRTQTFMRYIVLLYNIVARES